tara:strand:- start:2765 stop:3643 length:879 start_codon:yes stop_codon:yes gene_type:complete
LNKANTEKEKAVAALYDAKASEDKAKDQFERIELEQTLKNIINDAIKNDEKTIKEYENDEIQSFINQINVIDNAEGIQIQLEESNNAVKLEQYIENLLKNYPKVDDIDTGKLDDETARLYNELKNNSKLLFKIHEGEKINTITQATQQVAGIIEAEAREASGKGKVEVEGEGQVEPEPEGEETTVNNDPQEFHSRLLSKYSTNINEYDLISIIVNAYLLKIKIYIENKKLTAARQRGNSAIGRTLRFGRGGSKKRKYSFKKLPKRKRRNNKSNKTQVKKRGKRLNRSKKMSR